MLDSIDDLAFTDDDVDLMLCALAELVGDIKDLMFTDIDELTRKNAQMNLDFVTYAVSKLNNNEQDFSPNEGKVIFMAAFELRDKLNRSLDQNTYSTTDREITLATIRSANSVMRKLRKVFFASGHDIVAFLYP